MVMCSKCRKRVAVVFVAKVENGNKVTEGLCMKCAKELGIPVESMLGNIMDKFGIPAEMLEIKSVRQHTVPCQSPFRNQILQKKFDMMTQHRLAKNPLPCHIIA